MIDKEYQEINSYINHINTQILGSKDDLYYIANDTLTRNSFTTKILSKKLPPVTFRFILVTFFKFYIKAFILFFVFILEILIYKIFRKKSVIDNDILIDTYLIVDKVIKNSFYNDSYFMGIDKVLRSDQYTYLIKNFYGLSVNLMKFYKVVQILNKSDKNIISEFDLIDIIDIFKIFLFICFYPFKIEKVFKRYKNTNKIFDYSLIDSLNGSDIKTYIRYIVGQKIASKYDFKKVISWCEYQNIDKAFYKGINRLKRDLTIYGCQFLIPYNSWLNFFIPKSEKKFGLTPDILLTNGKYYLKFIEIDKKLGVSLRYSHLFLKKQKNIDEEGYILLLGSHIKDDTLKLINLIKSANLDIKIVLRLHPTDSFDNYKNHIETHWICSQKRVLDEDIEKSFLVITNDATGTSLETVCKGKSTIVFVNTDKFYSVPLVDYGKGKIWDIAFNEDDMKKLYNKLIEYRKNNQDEIQQIARWYRDNFFVEPTEENIVKAFDLDGEIYK